MREVLLQCWTLCCCRCCMWKSIDANGSLRMCLQLYVCETQFCWAFQIDRENAVVIISSQQVLFFIPFTYACVCCDMHGKCRYTHIAHGCVYVCTILAHYILLGGDVRCNKFPSAHTRLWFCISHAHILHCPNLAMATKAIKTHKIISLHTCCLFQHLNNYLECSHSHIVNGNSTNCSSSSKHFKLCKKM